MKKKPRIIEVRKEIIDGQEVNVKIYEPCETRRKSYWLIRGWDGSLPPGLTTRNDIIELYYYLGREKKGINGVENDLCLESTAENTTEIYLYIEDHRCRVRQFLNKNYRSKKIDPCKVFVLYFGEKTSETKIGKLLGVSQQNISKIIQKIKKWRRDTKYKPLDEFPTLNDTERQ